MGVSLCLETKEKRNLWTASLTIIPEKQEVTHVISLETCQCSVLDIFLLSFFIAESSSCHQGLLFSILPRAVSGFCSPSDLLVNVDYNLYHLELLKVVSSPPWGFDMFCDGKDQENVHMGCKGGTVGFPVASLLRRGSRYHVQMSLQVGVDSVIAPPLCPSALLPSVLQNITSGKDNSTQWFFTL